MQKVLSLFALFSATLFAVGCGALDSGVRDSSSSEVMATPTRATHVINADDVNVRNESLVVFSTARRGETVALTGRSKSSGGNTFKEVYFFEAPAGYGWVAQQFLSPMGSTPQPSGSPKIVVNLTQNKLFFYRGSELVRSWNVGTARAGKTTPTGSYRVRQKEACPPYFGSDGSHNVPGCTPENPFGPKALWFIDTMYGIHGTNQPWLIAEGTSASQRRVSNGCVRNENSNIEWLWNQVSVGTPIEITY